MDEQGTTRCNECGATLKVGAAWCSLCLTKVEPERTYAPADAFIGPPLPKTYSRTVKTSVSYGRTGRIVATLLLVVGPLAFLLTYAFPFGIIYLVAAAPLLLGSIWKRTPVPPGQDPSARWVQVGGSPRFGFASSPGGPPHSY